MTAVDMTPTPHTPRLKPHLPTLARWFDCQGHGRAHLGALVPTWEQNHSWQVELWDGAMSVTICIYMSCPNVSCVQESICVNLYPFLFLSLRPPSTLKVPVRFYYINVVTGDSVWEPPTRRWKEMVQAGKSTFWLRMETLRHSEFFGRSAGGLQNSQGLHHRHPRLHQPWAPVSKQRHRETPGSHVTMFLKNIHKFDGRNPAPPYCSYATDENGKIIHIKWYRLPSINSITSNHLL